jgi:glypican 4 (K-glypican)
MPKLGGRQRRAVALFNSNADLFLEDDDEDVARVRREANPGNDDNNNNNNNRRANRNNQEINVEPIKFSSNTYPGNNRGSSQTNTRGRSPNRNNQQRGSYMSGKTDSRESALDKLVKEIRQKVKDTKKFWSNLPYTACNNEDFAPAGNSDNCWNGHTVNR